MIRYSSIFTLIFISISVLSHSSVHAQDQPAVISGDHEEIEIHPAAEHPVLTKQMEKARESVYPALVNISVVSQRFDNGRARRRPGAGSGVIVSPEGHVLTNYHVAGNTTRIICTMSDGKRFKADVLVNDPLTDLSILKIDTEGFEGELPYATLGNSDNIEVGDFVLAMGNPLTLSSSMTLGIISNTQRVFTDFTGTDIQDFEFEEGDVTGIFTQWIQHDALILPGNSGGPLVNMNGEVIGINTLGVRSGPGFAVPSVLVSRVFEAALEHGEVPRAWLGVRFLPVEKTGHENGALVSWVMPGSPAEKAGLKAGDRIIELNDEEVNARFFEEVPVVLHRIADKEIGTELKILYERNGQIKTTNASLTQMEPYIGEEMEIRILGMTIRDITGLMALNRHLPTTQGVFVSGVRPGYPAEEARPRVRRGDVIVSVNNLPVANMTDLTEILNNLSDGDDVITLQVYRENEEIITVLDLKQSDRRIGAGELPKAWLGINTQVLTSDVAQALNLEETRGFRVTGILSGTQAAESDIRTGDIIMAVNDIELKAYRQQDVQELRRVIERQTIGEQVKLTVLRNNNEIEIPVKLEATPDDPAIMHRTEQEELEFSVRETTFMDGIDQNWPDDAEGLFVSDVTNGGWAHVSGLRINDLIVTIQGESVNSIEAFENIMDDILENQPEVIRIFLHRGHRTHFVFVDPDWEQLFR